MSAAGGSYCAEHQAEHRRVDDDRRGSSSDRGYGYKWQQARTGWLRKHPLCERCRPAVVIATVVDHIQPHRGDKELFWDRDNWQSLCKGCHDRKTATEDGGFGRDRAIAQ